MKKRLEVHITGNVQGVFFRKYLQEHALSRRITGYAKNNEDGSLSVVFEGDDEELQKVLMFCHMGPPGSQVKKIEKVWKIPTGEFSTFDRL